MRFICLWFLLSLTILSCKKYDVHDEDINGIALNLGTEPAYLSPRPYLYYDSGEWSSNQQPHLDSDSIPGNRSYYGKLYLWNYPGGPSGGGRQLRSAFIELGATHQVFYEVSDSLDLSITYRDLDCNGFPIGFETMIVAGSPSSGTLRITLMHNPDKNGLDVTSGNISAADGSVDYTYTFNVAVK